MKQKPDKDRPNVLRAIAQRNLNLVIVLFPLFFFVSGESTSPFTSAAYFVRGCIAALPFAFGRLSVEHTTRVTDRIHLETTAERNRLEARMNAELTKPGVWLQVATKDEKLLKRNIELATKEDDLTMMDENLRAPKELNKKDAELTKKDALLSRKDSEPSIKEIELGQKSSELSQKDEKLTLELNEKKHELVRRAAIAKEAAVKAREEEVTKLAALEEKFVAAQAETDALRASLQFSLDESKRSPTSDSRCETEDVRARSGELELRLSENISSLENKGDLQSSITDLTYEISSVRTKLTNTKRENEELCSKSRESEARFSEVRALLYQIEKNLQNQIDQRTVSQESKLGDSQSENRMLHETVHTLEAHVQEVVSQLSDAQHANSEYCLIFFHYDTQVMLQVQA
ncbi:hypothetical protein BJ742DRAFT_777452 [Cladochytrium replicatum]|nr:hypothetical protein BJ742DRAFT_777452 [Cladochytrium replicatum]